MDVLLSYRLILYMYAMVESRFSNKWDHDFDKKKKDHFVEHLVTTCRLLPTCANNFNDM